MAKQTNIDTDPDLDHRHPPDIQHKPGKGKPGKNKIEKKAFIDQTRFVDLLSRITTSIDNQQPVELGINGQACRIPSDIGERGKFRVEYEYENGEYELEFTLKWRE